MNPVAPVSPSSAAPVVQRGAAGTQREVETAWTPAKAVEGTETGAAERSEGKRETVVLLHGVGLNRWFMARLASALRREGYEVLNLSYPSRRFPLWEIGDTWLPAALARRGVGRGERPSVVAAQPAEAGEGGARGETPRALAGGGRVHFVTHSMGALVVRRYAATHGTEGIGRVVMIVPPNHGSEAADRLQRWAPVRWLLGRNLRVLGTQPPMAAALQLPASLGGEVEVGVLAGTRSINPLTRRLLPAPHDGAVSVASSHLAGEREHGCLPFTHTGILFRRVTARAVERFLRTGTLGLGCAPARLEPLP